MAFECEILADSVADSVPHRLTTFRVKIPAIIQPQILRHRMFSFSVASTRAIPLKKQIEAVDNDPFIPIHWGKARGGMQADEELGELDRWKCSDWWRMACRDARATTRALDQIGLHKQVTARLLTPFAWVDMVMTGIWPAFANFFALRCHLKAQPEIRRIAAMMARAYRDSIPQKLEPGWWHLPYLTPEELIDLRRVRLEDKYLYPELLRIQLASSVARCGRVSYGRHGQNQFDRVQEMDFYKKRRREGDWSVFEHQARVPSEGEDIAIFQGNLWGWIQCRQTLNPNVYTEFDFSILDRFE